MKKNKAGYKTSVLHAAGIRIYPKPIGQGIASKFRIVVTKTDKYGKVKEAPMKEPDRTYPVDAKKDEVSIWDQIKFIENYYYQKLTQKKNESIK